MYFLVAISLQALLVNAVFLLLGFGLMDIEPWTARLFVVGVFGEVVALVLVVVKYLFRPAGHDVLALASPDNKGDPHGD